MCAYACGDVNGDLSQFGSESSVTGSLLVSTLKAQRDITSYPFPPILECLQYISKPCTEQML
jgi:hypothetical protein